MSFSDLNEILNAIRKRNDKLTDCIKIAESVALWASAVGPSIAKHTKVMRVDEGGVLVVAVDHPIWMNECLFRKADILSKLKTTESEQTIYDIRFLLSDLKDNRNQSPGAFKRR